MKSFFSKHSPIGDYKWVCENFKDITGYEVSDVIGTNAYDYFHPMDLRQIVRSHEGSGRGTQQVVYRLRKKDGNYIWLMTFSHTSDGEIICLSVKLNYFHIIMFKIFSLFPNI